MMHPMQRMMLQRMVDPDSFNHLAFDFPDSIQTIAPWPPYNSFDTPAPVQQAQPPQTDETVANFANVALSLMLPPELQLIKAGLEVLASPNVPGAVKALVVVGGALILKEH